LLVERSQRTSGSAAARNEPVEPVPPLRARCRRRFRDRDRHPDSVTGVDASGIGGNPLGAGGDPQTNWCLARLAARAERAKLRRRLPMLTRVPVSPLDPRRFADVLVGDELDAWLKLVETGTRALAGRVIWNVNSTAAGGGVVELLRPLLGYARGGGVDARWLVISGDNEFFALTKRIHNQLHGVTAEGGPLGDRERSLYERALAPSAAELGRLVHAADVVVLHDPQTAGLVNAVHATGAAVIWRCHVGLDVANAWAREAWDFLEPYVLGADAYVFSRAAFVWDGLDEQRIAVIQPSIDAFSAKNAEQDTAQSLAILDRVGIIAHRSSALPTFTYADGTPGRVDRRAEIQQDAPLTGGDRIVAQISRWDRLKDPLGVLRGFVAQIAPRVDAHLLLAGPATDSVADDPEGAEVLAAVRAEWEGLSADMRRRVHLASLPMDDLEENAAIVNAIQHHADVIVQKSLAEGFGLTVSEAMWKRRPVVGTRIGGIQDQIVDGVSGVLVSDPSDLREYGDAVTALLGDRDRARAIGVAARERVRTCFLGPHELGLYFTLIQRVTSHGQVAHAARR
jgi:trehalose synthase